MMSKLFFNKVLCVLLTLTLLGSTVIFAAPGEKVNISLSYANVTALLDRIGAVLFADGITSAARSSNFRLMHDFLVAASETDSNDSIDIAIGVLKGESTALPGSAQAILEGLAGENGEYTNTLVFGLCVFKSLPYATKKTALNNFLAKKTYENVTGGNLTQTQGSALNRVYASLVAQSHRDDLLTYHELTAQHMLTLASAIKGTFVVTDGSSSSTRSKLVYKSGSINSTFAGKLADNVSKHFSAINGEAFGSGAGIVERLVNVVSNGITSDARRDDFKTVLGILGMYEEYKTSSPSSPGNRPGSGTPAIVVPTMPTPPAPQPVVIPAPPEPQPEQETFTDVSVSHWSAPYIYTLTDRQLFNGYEGGSFQPDQGITREEVAVAIVRALGLSQETTDGVSFTDADALGDWSKDAVALLVSLGIFKGYDDGSFRPKNTVTRQELAVILARAIDALANNAIPAFVDADEIADWARSDIHRAYALGIIRGYDDNSFRPENDVTRAEAAVMLYNFLFTMEMI